MVPETHGCMHPIQKKAIACHSEDKLDIPKQRQTKAILIAIWFKAATVPPIRKLTISTS